MYKNQGGTGASKEKDKEEQLSLEETKAENQELYQQLTNKTNNIFLIKWSVKRIKL